MIDTAAPIPTFAELYPDLEIAGMTIIQYGRENKLTGPQLARIFNDGLVAQFVVKYHAEQNTKQQSVPEEPS